MSRTAFKIPHLLLSKMLAQGAFAALKSERSVENAVNLVKLVRISVGSGWVETASIAPDIASNDRLALTETEGEGDVCVSALDIIKDIDSLQKPHTVTVEWDGHGTRQTPAGKVTLSAVTDKGRKTLTWTYDAYDPTNVPALVGQPSQGPLLSLNLETLKDCVGSIGWAVKPACTEGVFDNVLLRTTENGIQFVATDGTQIGIVTPVLEAHKIGTKKQDFLLLNANLLKKALSHWNETVEISIVEDGDHVWLTGEGFGLRFPSPSNEVRNRYPVKLLDRLMATPTEVKATLDRVEFIQAAKAAMARASGYCALALTDGATEISSNYRNSSKPALVGCSDATGTLKKPIRLSCLGLLNASQAMRGDLMVAVNPDETRAVVRDTENPRIFFAFQHISET